MSFSYEPIEDIPRHNARHLGRYYGFLNEPIGPPIGWGIALGYGVWKPIVLSPAVGG